MGKIIKYRAYTIESCPISLLDTGQWKLNIFIAWEEQGARTARHFYAENTYATEDEADLHGITYGQRIIDGKVPGLTVE